MDDGDPEEERGNDIEGVDTSIRGVDTSNEGVDTSNEGDCYIYQHTKTPNTQTNTPSQITKTGGFAAGSGDDALRKERVTGTVTGLAAILRLSVTLDLRRLVEFPLADGSQACQGIF
ncbi:MAG TPA: hypothetical protein VKR06_07155 [Ktedonosporobacter sp.]|nr:hypothetical protein [Ktedonosporobacter sp.]